MTDMEYTLDHKVIRKPPTEAVAALVAAINVHEAKFGYGPHDEECCAAILDEMPDWVLMPRVATADWTGSTKRADAVPDAEVARLRQVEAAARAFMAHYEGINVKSQALANLRAALAKP